MPNRKNQNSLLILTTLGVCFGLLLVGGVAPQVFAHSATTRNFEITDEIDVKDDLDTNPGNDVHFIESIVDLLRDDEDSSRYFLGTVDFNNHATKRFESTVIQLANSLLDTKVEFKAGKKYTNRPETFNFKLFSNGGEFKFEVSMTAENAVGAKQLGSLITEYLSKASKEFKSAETRIIAENTTSKVNDVKVILVTSLPRSGLDSHLVTRAK